jgi:hypothetical protein
VRQKKKISRAQTEERELLAKACIALCVSCLSALSTFLIASCTADLTSLCIESARKNERASICVCACAYMHIHEKEMQLARR